MSTEEESVKNIAVLKKRRAIIQGSCTRIKTFVESVPPAAITPSITAQLQERLSKLDRYWSDYESVQTNIELLDENESNNRAGFEDAFYSLAGRIRELLTPNSSRQAINPSPTSSRASNAPDPYADVKLPKLLPLEFSGKYDEWFPFLDTFLTTIHANESLHEIQKLRYLRSYLKGEAKNIISSLETSAHNYEVAWDLLRKRYDNKRAIAEKHISAIMELPSMKQENAGELRQIADGATRHIHALQALKRPTSHWDDLLIHILSNKLDPATNREWKNSLKTTELPTFKQFMDFITHHSEMLESTEQASVSASKDKSRASSSAKRQAACVASVKLKCSHCGEEHSIYHCPKFLEFTIPQRIAEIKRAKICVNCLRSTDHAANKCTSGSCRICKKKHNTLLHLTEKTQSQAKIEKPQEAATSASSSAAVVTHSTSRNNECVMLATATVHAYDHKGSRKPCRVLLDCGSQANFISKSFLDTLGIKTRSSNISISGINSTITRSSQIAQVCLQSRINTFTATIECIVTERVTDKLPAFTLKRSAFELPRNLPLADPQFHRHQPMSTY